MKSYESSLLLFSKYVEEEFQLSKVEEIKLIHTKERGKYSYISDDTTVSINNPSIRKDFWKVVSPMTINNL